MVAIVHFKTQYVSKQTERKCECFQTGTWNEHFDPILKQSKLYFRLE